SGDQIGSVCRGPEPGGRRAAGARSRRRDAARAGGTAALAGAAPLAGRGRDGLLVAVGWSELPDAGDGPPVKRRVWAATIADGLAAMVEDRRTDEVLERIERSANAEDDPWDAL